MTEAVSSPHPNAWTKLPRWQLLTIMVGFPLAYWINGLMPWCYGLFVKRDHSFFIPFGLSVCLLHWASLLAALYFLRQAGGRPSDLGFHMRVGGMVALVVTVVVVGGLLIAVRRAWPIFEAPPNDVRFYYPFTLAERCFFIFMALSAGICEEIVYRGFAISALQGRGWRTWQAVVLSTLSFVFIHGIASIFMFPFLFLAGLLYAGIFLWRKDLTLAIWLHALFDVMAVMAI
ncbi:CAAX amino terminal protease self- immunity [Anatilimnocola aggregata]|uniref:CAAX amino terminal protease self-immunity n=1 Tax=Anatilimnocola aggregata TaxID=2528021 RepID=A0A517YP09_9BACT|nr:CPBP family intramembrane glutamic endopeptidase [Anatilimnocola aggregata]QDU31961.1 CAAX amino terminal protease self- immunity [Anatilimnocola aggregata]